MFFKHIAEIIRLRIAYHIRDI
ncbi:MAG: hypothetical protein K0R46_293, partial [Herbinix sp.]|nr:hypothetical protein [Herbinix sp.]